MRRERILAFSLACVLVIVGRACFAQQPDSPPSGPPALVYLPYSDLLKGFEQPQNVVIPYGDYQRLLNFWQSHQQPSATQKGVLTQAEYDITAEGNSARIQLRLTAELFADGPVAIPVNFGGLAIGKVSGDKNPVLERGTRKSDLLHLRGKGTQVISIEMTGQSWLKETRLELVPIGPAPPISTLKFSVRGKNRDVSIQPQALIVSTATEGDSTQIVARLAPSSFFTISWNADGSNTEAELLANARNLMSVSLQDGIAQTHSQIALSVLRGKLPHVRIALPNGERLLSVRSPIQLRNWRQEESGGRSSVLVEFATPVEKEAELNLQLERKLDPSGLTFGGPDGFHVEGVNRESGQLIFQKAPGFSTTVQEQQGLVRINGPAIDSRLLSGGDTLLAFQFYSSDYLLRLAVDPIQPRILATSRTDIDVREGELLLKGHYQFAIDRAGVFDLSFQLPEGVTINDVSCPEMKEFRVDAGSRKLIVEFRERIEKQISLEIHAHQKLPDDASSPQPLPLIEPLDVERDTGVVHVFASDSLEVITQQSGLQSAHPLAIPQQLPTRGDATLAASWSFNHRPVVIPVTILHKPVRLAADVATLVEMQPDLTQVKTELLYRIDYAGVDTFRFEVPESISSRVRIENGPNDQSSAPIKQKSAAPAENGRVVWTVTTQRPATGRQRLQVQYEIPAATGKDQSEATLTIQPVRPLGLVNASGEVTTPLTRVQGEIAVLQDRSLSVNVTPSGNDIEPIDPRELSNLPQDAAFAYRYYRDLAARPVELALQSRRFEVQPVVSTVVSRSLVEVVTSQDAEATYRCRYQVKTSERQRLLVFLPVNLEVLGAFLNDREVKLEKGTETSAKSPGPHWTPFWINVARPESSETPFLLTFQFLWKVNPPLGESQFGRGRIALPLPILGADDASVVQDLKAVVWVPHEFVLVGNPQGFELLQRKRPFSWLVGRKASHSTQTLDPWISAGQKVAAPAELPTDGRIPYVYSNLGGAHELDVRWWKKISMTLTFSLAVAIIGWVLMGTAWENKLTITLLTAFVASLYGLVDSHGLNEGLTAARFGILFVIGLWIIHGLFHRSRGTLDPEKSPPAGNAPQPAATDPVVPPQPDGGAVA
ncbi:hypothetical protein [Planctomicrobium sp. SH664]|uniref:hypothetical protein n=1 Tax=Planctomicrobium sp. SH664 TaxID=3448125 RepID=UPI003F5C363B